MVVVVVFRYRLEHIGPKYPMCFLLCGDQVSMKVKGYDSHHFHLIRPVSWNLCSCYVGLSFNLSSICMVRVSLSPVGGIGGEMNLIHKQNTQKKKKSLRMFLFEQKHLSC